MIGDIGTTIETEISAARELATLIEQAKTSFPDEQRLLSKAIESLKIRIKILNRGVGAILSLLNAAQKLPGKEKPLGVERVTFGSEQAPIVLKSSDKDDYIYETNITRQLLKRLKHKESVIEKKEEYKTPNAFVRLANKFFLDYSRGFIERGTFKDLNINLRKANLTILTSSYVSTMLFSTVLAFFAGAALTIFFLLFSLTSMPPFFELVDEGHLIRFTKTIWFALLMPALTLALFYFYPSAERKAIARQIDSELPFVVIHMGSIAGSGVEPVQIFKIVGLSKDYKNTRGEMRKLLNQINIYGYDLVTALKNIARLTPSTRLAELFTGLAVTISSGGDLKTFFEKRAETLLLAYRIEREKFAKTAETFMDIYISVVIAAPMILLLLLIMISVSQVSAGGLGTSQMTFLIILIVVAINIVFLWVISLKQPSY